MTYYMPGKRWLYYSETFRIFYAKSYLYISAIFKHALLLGNKLFDKLIIACSIAYFDIYRGSMIYKMQFFSQTNSLTHS